MQGSKALTLGTKKRGPRSSEPTRTSVASAAPKHKRLQEFRFVFPVSFPFDFYPEWTGSIP